MNAPYTDDFVPAGDLLEGAFVLPAHADGEIPLEDPADLGALAGGFPFARAHVDRAVEAARRAAPGWRATPPAARAEALGAFGRLLAEEAEPLARLIARETGKTLAEARAEAALLPAKIGITLGEGADLLRERTIPLAPGREARWRNPPRGILAVLAPFNFPLHLLHGHAIPALATGNVVVAKPSERAPAAAQRYARIARAAGLPPGVFQIVQGDGESGRRLAAHPDVDGVLFTGSFAVGRSLQEAVREHPRKILALEMGGKNGLVVAEDADLAAAAEAVALGACATSGQRCTSTSRAIVLRPVADEFLSRLLSILRGMVHGHPLDPGVFLGPVISADARARHGEIHRLSRAEGAEPLLAGGPCEGPFPGHYVRPSVHLVRRRDPASAYQADEHFVPDVAVFVVDAFEEAVTVLDETEYGLAGSIYTADRARFDYALDRARLGLLHWNAPTIGASSRLPFGGLKRSGNGRPAGVVSGLYCTTPVVSIESPTPQRAPKTPGFPFA